jgi:hypothetical protein
MKCPDWARGGEVISVTGGFSYDVWGLKDYQVSFSSSTPKGPDEYHGPYSSWVGYDTQPPNHYQGTHEVGLDLDVSPYWTTPYSWKLSFRVTGEGHPPETAHCVVQIIDARAPPLVKIRYVEILNFTYGLYPTESIASDLPGLGSEIRLHSGQPYRLVVHFDYSMPYYKEATIILRYRDSIEGEWNAKDVPSGLFKFGTRSEKFECCDVHTPPDFGGTTPATAKEWTFDFELNVDAEVYAGVNPKDVFAGKATDSHTLSLLVTHASKSDKARFFIYKVTGPTLIQKDAQVNVQAEGAYDIPEGQTATLHISFAWPHTVFHFPFDESVGLHHTTEKLTGQGTWSEVLSAKRADDLIWYYDHPKDTEGRYSVVIFEDFKKPLAWQEVNVKIAAAPSEDFHCHITDVKHPSEVTHGQDVTVTVELERKLSKGSSLAISIWDKNLFPQQNGELASDTMKDAEGTGSMSVTIKILGANVRPENGPWTLQAVSTYETPETGKQLSPDKFDFTVNVVGAAGPKGAGGKTDWSITSIQVAPYKPTQDEPTIFQTAVEADPIPTGPLQVQVACRLDGIELFGGYVNYGANMGFVVVFSQPWKTTLGAHTLACDVDPNQKYDDQNKNNNHRELKFTVTKSYTPPPPPPDVPQGEFDFYVTATPTEQTLASSATFAVNVKLVSGTVQPVQLELSNVPAGISYSFAPSSGAPPYNSTLTLTATTGLPAGTYSLTIKASGGQGQLYKERYKPLTLIVKSGPTYSLSITPDTAQAQPGENVTFTVSASSETGYANYVNLIVAGAPNGSLAKLEPTALTAPSQSTLTLKLSKDVKPGSYLLVLAGSGPGGQSAVATLSVIGPQAPPTPQPTGNEELIVNGLAAGILGGIIAAIAAGTFLTFRRFKARRAMVYCIECGAQIPASLPYCRRCGAKQPQQGKEH